MKPRLTPTEIVLKDLPPDGREFIFTRESGELNSTLEDLIQRNPYQAKLHITPMGNAFDLRGSVQTSMDLQCSICASDFNYKVKQDVHELIVIQKPFNKGDQQTRANHAHEWAKGGPDYILLESDLFDAANYIHEVIGLAEPIRPIGRPDCDANCDETKPLAERPWLTYGNRPEKSGDSIRQNPFQVLEKIKLKD